MEMRVAGRAHDRRDARVQPGDAELCGRLHRHGIVLHVDEQPVEAAHFQDLRGIDGPRLTQADTDGDLASLPLRLGDVLDDGHRMSSVRSDAQRQAEPAGGVKTRAETGWRDGVYPALVPTRRTQGGGGGV